MTSAVEITYAVSGEQLVAGWLSALPGQLTGALSAQAGFLTQQIMSNIINDKLSGQVLSSRSGKLKDSITSSVDSDDAFVSGSLAVDGIPYAAILEYGGTTKAHVIEAVNAKALAFGFQGKQAFYRQVQHPGSVIPERSFMRSALQESSDVITAAFKQALADIISN